MNNVKINYSLGFCGGPRQGQKEVSNISTAVTIVKAKTQELKHLVKPTALKEPTKYVSYNLDFKPRTLSHRCHKL